MRIDGRQRGRHRRAHRRAHHGESGSGRRGRIRHRFPGPRRARIEGHPRRLEAVCGERVTLKGTRNREEGGKGGGGRVTPLFFTYFLRRSSSFEFEPSSLPAKASPFLAFALGVGRGRADTPDWSPFPAMEITSPVSALIGQKGSDVWSIAPDTIVFDAIQMMSEKK